MCDCMSDEYCEKCKHLIEELTDEQANKIRESFMTVNVKDKTVTVKDWLDDSAQTTKVK